MKITVCFVVLIFLLNYIPLTDLAYSTSSSDTQGGGVKGSSDTQGGGVKGSSDTQGGGVKGSSDTATKQEPILEEKKCEEGKAFVNGECRTPNVKCENSGDVVICTNNWEPPITDPDSEKKSDTENTDPDNSGGTGGSGGGGGAETEGENTGGSGGGETPDKLNTKHLSGKSWVNKFPTSKEVNDLEAGFKTKVQNFIDALTEAGATVDISATERPKERAFLMHWSWKIAKENYDATLVPSMVDVDINWWHGNEEKSKNAAQEMVDAYGINNLKVAPSLTSNHIQGKAIDMSISWQENLNIKNANGKEILITSQPRDGLNKDLMEIGRSYGVIHFGDFQGGNPEKDKPHWSTNGR